MNIEPRYSNIQTRIDELKDLLEHNKKVKEQTEKILDNDVSSYSDEQINHLVNKLNITTELIEQYEQEIQDLEGLQ